MRRRSARLWSLVAQALRGTVARPAGAVIAAIVVAAVCGVVLGTTGRTAATENEVMSSVDSAGARLIVVSDDAGSAGLTAASLPVLGSLEGVEWAAGIGPVWDMYNAALPAGSDPVAVRPIYGDLSHALSLTKGREPGAGEAIIGAAAADRTGITDGAGGLRASASAAVGGALMTDLPVVGQFAPDPALASLTTTALVAQHPDPQAPVWFVYLMARDAAWVSSIAAAVPQVVTAANPQALKVEQPEGLIALRGAISQSMAQNGRALMVTVLGVGLVVVTLTMLGFTASRRRDFGRQRALGASRSAIVVSVITQGMLAAVAGAALGTAAGLASMALMRSPLPSASFTCGVAALALCMTVVATIPPALSAALRDPVRILRVP